MPDDAVPPFRLSPACLAAGTATPLAERRDRRSVRLFALLLAPLVLLIAYAGGIAALLVSLVLAVSVAYWFARRQGARHRRRRELWLRPFPADDEAILEAEIPHYSRLDADGRELFRQRTKLFLDEVAFHGAGVEADAGLRLRAAAAAVIPTLGFPEWHWPDLREVIFRPEGYEEGAYMDDEGVVTEFEESGMVGESGVLSGVMMLSADDLIWEFAHPEDGANVGFHEFAHLMADEGLALAEGDRAGWPKLMTRERKLIETGESLLDEYALLNEDELFAVASEMFFTIPGRFRRRHGELYAVLVRAYRQDPCRWFAECGSPVPAPRKRRRRGSGRAPARRRRFAGA